MKARVTKFLTVILAFSFFSLLITGGVSAQNFSGSDPCNYYCPKLPNAKFVVPSSSTLAACPSSTDEKVQSVWLSEGSETGGVNYVCWYNVTTVDSTGKSVTNTVQRNASPFPPTLTQVEVWFVRIIYIAWALAGIYFTGVLMYIGFLYLTSMGNDNATADAIRALRKWIVGVALVFLAYPALNTFFAILPLNTDISCYEEIKSVLPGFQLVFPNICTNTSTGVTPGSDACKANPALSGCS